MFTMFLGTDRCTWLTMNGPKLMISLNTLPKKKTYPAAEDWFLDSGGFTELQKYGTWRTTAEEHIARCRHAQRFDKLVFASPQDWMCEPAVINGGKIGLLNFTGTGLTLFEHQIKTVNNFCELRHKAPDVPFIPVLQGWEPSDYLRCADMYEEAGIDLAAEPLVGVGSVCRRQAMGEAVEIMQSLFEREYKLHGFGFKQAGIKSCWQYMASADSMAWSYNARAEKNGCGGRQHCGHCRHYALDWYNRTIGKISYD